MLVDNTLPQIPTEPADYDPPVDLRKKQQPPVRRGKMPSYGQTDSLDVFDTGNLVTSSYIYKFNHVHNFV